VADCPTNPKFHFDSVAGRYVVLCFYGSMTRPDRERIVRDFVGRTQAFDDVTASFFGISADPEDERSQPVPVR
jgi:peroxiredoxin